MVFNRLNFKKNFPFIVTVCAVVAVSIFVCAFAFCCSGGKIDFSADYYYVCMYTADNAVSAGSLSGTVADFGGAGYILKHNGGYHVAVACYYNDTDAKKVAKSLGDKGMNCKVLNVAVDGFKVPSSAKKNENLYSGNLNTLNSLSVLAYECANAIDVGEYSQARAKSVLSAISDGLNGLKNANTDTCFFEDLCFLASKCEDISYGYVYSKDVRYLQIAITDAIINCEMY